jgi:hypothetical protein
MGREKPRSQKRDLGHPLRVDGLADWCRCRPEASGPVESSRGDFDPAEIGRWVWGPRLPDVFFRLAQHFFLDLHVSILV